MESDLKSFEYVLHHATEDRIKIGRSVNPFIRSLARKLDDIDHSRSLQMAVEYGTEGRSERMLQFVARKFAVGHRGDGHTEWFEVGALPKVLAFTKRNPEEFPSEFVVLEVPEPQSLPEP
jgi:hypothetical protein